MRLGEVDLEPVDDTWFLVLVRLGRVDNPWVVCEFCALCLQQQPSIPAKSQQYVYAAILVCSEIRLRSSRHAQRLSTRPSREMGKDRDQRRIISE